MATHWTNGVATLYHADAKAIPLPDASVHCVVTSPPYWGLRDYGLGKWKGGDPSCSHRKDIAREDVMRTSTIGYAKNTGHAEEPWPGGVCGHCGAVNEAIWEGGNDPLCDHTLRNPRTKRQTLSNSAVYQEPGLQTYKGTCGRCGAMQKAAGIGTEETLDEYIVNLVDVFREVWRVLRDDGVVFLNLGDAYFGSGGAHTNAVNPGISNSFVRSGNVGRGGRSGKGGKASQDLTGSDSAWQSLCGECADSLLRRNPDIARRLVLESPALAVASSLAHTESSVAHSDSLRSASLDDQNAPASAGYRHLIGQSGVDARDVPASTNPESSPRRRESSRQSDNPSSVPSGVDSSLPDAQASAHKLRPDSVMQPSHMEDNEVPAEGQEFGTQYTAWCCFACGSWSTSPIRFRHIVPDKPLESKQLMGLPWRVAFALQDDGWIVRSPIVWHKPNPMPESVRDRPTNAYEHIFLLVKRNTATFWTHRDGRGVRTKPQADTRYVDALDGAEHTERPAGYPDERIACPECDGNGEVETGMGQETLFGETIMFAVDCEDCDATGEIARWAQVNLWTAHDYFYDGEPLREPSDNPNRPAWGRTRKAAVGDSRNSGENVHAPSTTSGANARNVWTFPTQGRPDAHFATFPDELPRRCILAGTSEYGVCAACGAPWARVIDTKYVKDPRHTGVVGRRDGGDGKSWAGTNTPKLNRTTQTLGWQPTCECGADVTPAVVLDPFVGSGTTAAVAQSLGRRGVGTDLNTEYLDIAARRIAKIPMPMVMVMA